MTHSPDYYRLIRTINHEPDDDTARLVFADYVDENATTDSKRARAELIRTQLGVYIGSRFFKQDVPHAQELIKAHSTAWRRPVCEKCEGRGWNPFPDPAGGRELHDECRACHGIGSTGALSEIKAMVSSDRKPSVPIFTHTVIWVRGMPQVEVAFGEMGFKLDGEPWCFVATWLAWATRAVREEGAFLKIINAAQYLHDDISGVFWWRDSPVYDHLTLPSTLTPPANENQFESVESAYEWLSRKVTSVVVERAYPVLTKVTS